MGLFYRQLNFRVRDAMVAEIQDDIRRHNLYVSPRLTSLGKAQWGQLLLSAAISGTDESLASSLLGHGLTIGWAGASRNSKSGPSAAGAETLAEGEFNRYYIRGICIAALDEGVNNVVVYRGKEVWAPRPGSERLVGQSLPAKGLLEDLRNNVGRDTYYGVPGGPNSGLTVEY